MEILNILNIKETITKLPDIDDYISGDFVLYSMDDMTYQTFFDSHLIQNIPCLIKYHDRWFDLEWTFNDKPNFEYLTNKFGDATAPVADCGNRYFNAQKKEEQTLQQYLCYWKNYIAENYSTDLPCLYLKDWHFTRDFPNENLYRVPYIFASDWLNEYFTSREDVLDDYRFVYMGPKGSWTPLHADVFSSYSWSVNMCGKKRWILYPPGQEKCLVDNHGNLAYDVESPTLNDSSIFQNYNKLKNSIEIIQNPGEAIFVPSGWHHQVWNLDDTISINHNWVNGCNIKKMWNSIKQNLAAVKSEISDCRNMEDWTEHCQLLLNASYGLDYPHFCQLLLHILTVRLKHLQENTCLKVNGDWLIGTNHIKFDVIQARHVLLNLISDDDFIQLHYYSEVKHDIQDLLDEINTTLSKK